ncbi:MAG: class I adenylate-forming enzyme family protein [Reyranellaceae bacterium]
MNVADLLAMRAAEIPDATAVMEGERSLALGALDAAVWGLAALLRREGVRPGDVVGLQTKGSLLHLTASFALARIGAVQLAISADAAAAQRNDALLKRANASAVVTDRPDALSPAWSRIPLDPEGPFSLAGRPDAALRHPGGNWPLMYKSSSGTTGTPKLIGATHEGMIASIRREQVVVGYPVGERYMTPVDLQFDAPKRRYFACIAAGGTAVMSPQGLEIDGFCDALDRYGIRHFSCVPRQASDIANFLPPGRQRFAAMRCFRLSAAPAGRHTLELLRERICSNIVLSYGCSELGPMTFAGPAVVRTAPQSVGRAMPGISIEIVSNEDAPLAPATTGIVRVRAEGMPASYVDDPQATARHFRHGWFYPGDLGSLSPDGMLTLMGRSDDMMIFDGMNIAPMEIETVLQEHPAVLETAAFPLRSRESYQLPVAAVVLRHEVDMTDLMRFARNRLGGRAPLFIVSVNALPRNQGGKVLKNDLAAAVENHLNSRSGSRK